MHLGPKPAESCLLDACTQVRKLPSPSQYTTTAPSALPGRHAANPKAAPPVAPPSGARYGCAEESCTDKCLLGRGAWNRCKTEKAFRTSPSGSHTPETQHGIHAWDPDLQLNLKESGSRSEGAATGWGLIIASAWVSHYSYGPCPIRPICAPTGKSGASLPSIHGTHMMPCLALFFRGPGADGAPPSVG